MPNTTTWQEAKPPTLAGAAGRGVRLLSARRPRSPVRARAAGMNGGAVLLVFVTGVFVGMLACSMKGKSSGALATDTSIPSLAIAIGTSIPAKPLIADNALFTTIQAANLDAAGAVIMPGGINAVVFEIGVSDLGTLDTRHIPTNPSRFLISFEPLVDKYAWNLGKARAEFSRGVHDLSTPLGMHNKRGIILPLGISEEGGLRRFTVSAAAGCSSLMEFNQKSNWGRGCFSKQTSMERRTIQTMTLQGALRLAGDKPIAMIKLDAQGMDFKLVNSTPPHALASVRSIKMEARSDLCEPLYVGQEGCNIIQARMKELGFGKMRPATCPIPLPSSGVEKQLGPNSCEFDLMFYRGARR